MEVNGQLVLMRKEDGFLNATQVITLAKKNESERKYILELIKQETKVEVLPATVGIPSHILGSIFNMDETSVGILDWSRSCSR